MQEIQQLNSENDQLRVLLGEKDKTIKLLNQNLERKTYEVGKYSNENAELREAITAQNETCKAQIDCLKEEKVQMEAEMNTLIAMLKQKDSVMLNENDEMKSIIQQLENQCAKYENEKSSSKSKIDNQIRQIETMNKEKQKLEENNKEVLLTIQRVKSESYELKKQVSLLNEENQSLKDSMGNVKQTSLSCDQETLYLDKIDKQSVKIDELTKESYEKDHRYSQLVERLQQTQEQFKQFQESQAEELNEYILKSEHRQVVQKLHQENQVVVKEVKKLLQTIEKYKQDEEKLKQIMNSTESSLSHDQLLMIKEFKEISALLMQYDDGKVSQNKRTITDLLSQILNDYDSLNSRYKIVEAQLIDVKVKYAEAEEVKERLLIDMENSGDNNVSRLSRGSRGDRSYNNVDSEQPQINNFKRVLKPAPSTSFLSKASSLFGAASSYYNDKFGNNE